MKHLQHTSKTSETLENIRLQHALSANPGRRVGGRCTAQWDLTLGRSGEGGWSHDAAEEVEPRTESARGPPRRRERRHGGRRAQGRQRVQHRATAWRGTGTRRRGRPPRVPAWQSVWASLVRATRRGQSRGMDISEAEWETQQQRGGSGCAASGRMDIHS